MNSGEKAKKLGLIGLAEETAKTGRDVHALFEDVMGHGPVKVSGKPETEVSSGNVLDNVYSYLEDIRTSLVCIKNIIQEIQSKL